MSLLGRNGVGKTTTLRSIMGLTAPRQGKVAYKGQNITGKPAFRIAKLGIGFVPEDRRIFPDLSVGKTSRWPVNRQHHRTPQSGPWSASMHSSLS